MEDGTVENELCPVYIATCPDPRALSPDPDEVDTVEWVDWRDFRADVLAGRREVSPWCVAQIAAFHGGSGTAQRRDTNVLSSADE